MWYCKELWVAPVILKEELTGLTVANFSKHK